MDKRDARTWVIAELSPVGEAKAADGTLADVIRRDLDVGDDFGVFVPVLTYPKGVRNITIFLMEGYVFIQSGLPEVSYFALEQKAYLSHVVSSSDGKMRVLNVLPDSKIEEFKKQLRAMVSSEIQVGDTVHVIKGHFTNLEGVVVNVAPDTATLRVTMRSLDLIVTQPLVFLEAILPSKEA